jgi:hypothetical protein
VKKLLVLAVLAALTNLANGMTLEISVNGGHHSNTVFLDYETAELAIYSPDGFNQGDDVFWGLVIYSSTGPATISGGIVTALAPDASFLAPEEDLADLAEMFGAPGVFGGIDTLEESPTYTAPGGVYFDEIYFHGSIVNLVVLRTTTDFETYTNVDYVEIWTPEPGTIALLSLGGLMLRRRK